MSRFWVYFNPLRGRLLIHTSGCPACEGDKPFLLEGVAARPGPARWEPAESYRAAAEIAGALASSGRGLVAKDCVICDPGGARPAQGSAGERRAEA